MLAVPIDSALQALLQADTRLSSDLFAQLARVDVLLVEQVVDDRGDLQRFEQVPQSQVQVDDPLGRDRRPRIEDVALIASGSRREKLRSPPP